MELGDIYLELEKAEGGMGEWAGQATQEAESVCDDCEPVISPEHDEVWDLAEIQRIRVDFQTGRNVKTDAEVRGHKAHV